MKKIGFIAGIIVFLLLIGFKLSSNKKVLNEQNKPVDRSAVPISVTVAEVEEGIIENVFSLPAVLKPVSEVNITINNPGIIKTLNFDLGTRVSKGQIIGSIDNSMKLINLSSAELVAQKAETDFLRIKELYAGKAATEVDYQNAKYNYENSKNQVALIKQQIADGNLVSPVNGVISRKNIDPGEFVNAGTAIATVVDVSSLKASVMVSERDVYALLTGMPVRVTTDIYPGKEFNGKIRYISDAGDESHNYEVEITVENHNNIPLKAGTFIRVSFDIQNSGKVIQIPKLSLVEGTKNPYVYVVQGNKPLIRKIAVGRDLGEKIEVVNGLEPGERVITSGQINLTENSIIEIIGSNSAVK